MILKMVLGLMQSILSFVLGLLPLPDVPAWLVELTETILGYMKTGMGIVLFFVPQVVLEGALDLIIVVWTVVHGYKLVMFWRRKTCRKATFWGDFVYLRLYEYPEAKSKRFRVVGINGSRPVGGERAEPTEHDKRSAQNLARARRTIRDLILCNPFRFFCTFTFSDSKIDRYDYKACKKAITKFFDNFRTRHASHFIYILVPERHKDGAWHFHGLVAGIPAGEFYTPEFITYRDRRSQKLKVIRNTKGYMRWRRWPYGHFDCSVIKDYEASATYVSKYITKDLISVMKGAHLYFSSKGLRRPSLVFDEDNVPFPMKPQYSDEFCKLSWASGGDVIGDLLPSWYDDMCADICDIDMPERLTERSLFSELTVEQLSLLESSEQVPVPWDM